ncbi:glycosyltransferase family 2 protein [Wukongibacter sp. M2B1]|uniref:glycosyltransferase family 2 protein n=1 Tax=Wukongibacter sp. M2B1 TaxID=3088895 RepID=UPI003D78B477
MILENKLRILIGSPVRQNPNILKEFLESLKQLNKENLLVDYYFIDNNEDVKSKELLKDFMAYGKIELDEIKVEDLYVCDENTHKWNERLIWRVADYKNRIIEHCKKESYDYLFMIDSDIVLHPSTLTHLIETKKDIISEIFWTKWKSDGVLLPQVWLYDQYSLVPQGREEKLTKEEAARRNNLFIKELRKPGIYKVGGLGACTLISKKALEKGVDYREIYNISFWGEDRHFCIKAVALGFELFVDTHYPAYHIYRQSDLDGVEKYRDQSRNSNKMSCTIESSGLKSRIRAIMEDFIQSHFTCDYRIFTGFEGYKYLSYTYRHKLSMMKSKIINYLESNKVISKAKLLSMEIKQIGLDRNSVDVKVEFVIDNIGKEENRYYGNITLKRNNDSDWIISYMSFKNDNRLSLLGNTAADILMGKERINKEINNKITLSMLVRNEANNILNRVLNHAKQYVDNVVILDDNSTDNTVEICKEVLKDIPLIIKSNRESNFNNEIIVRKQLWQMTIATNPDWILCLDADEIFEDSIVDYIESLINQSSFDYYAFRLYDFWNNTHYREDTYWCAHKYYRPFLLRYQPNFDYDWYEMSQHCGRIPYNINLLDGCNCNIRLKHYGWANEELRRKKLDRYMKLDPEGEYGNINQYRSILDPNPRLVEF